VTEEQDPAAQPAIVKSLLSAPLAEQQRLLAWGRGLGAIRHGDLSERGKAAALLALTREQKAAWPLAKVLLRALRIIVWDARSWKLRLGLGAVVATFMVVGSSGGGTVALGAGLRLPLWALIGAGGTLIGALVDWLQRRGRKP
jgi:hypothetical protein